MRSALPCTGNNANQGGAIYIGERIPADISHCEFVLNSATGQFGQGGAIYILSSSTANPTSVTLSNLDVNGNVASGSRGGGIMVSDSTGAGTSLTLVSTQIRNNIVSGADSKGGGVFFGAGVIGLFGVTVSDNEANSGDGIYSVTGTAVNPYSFYSLNNDTWDTGPY